MWLFTVSYWRKDSGPFSFTSERGRRRTQKQRRSQDPWHVKGPGYCHNFRRRILNMYSQESGLLQAASPFYKTFAIDCSRAQVSVDMFLFSASYQDVATLGENDFMLIGLSVDYLRATACLPHYTSGQTYYYPAFNAARTEDAIKFAHEFGEVLAMPIMLEAVMRVRASRGLRMASFHGNFFVRSTDLLAMPAVPQDQSYAIEIQIEETITTPFVVFQTAVLHTTCYGSLGSQLSRQRTDQV